MFKLLFDLLPSTIFEYESEERSDSPSDEKRKRWEGPIYKIPMTGKKIGAGELTADYKYRHDETEQPR